MKKRILSLLLMAIVSLTALVGCGGEGEVPGGATKVDYAAQAVLDMSSGTKKLEANLDSYLHIDGDTTHFKDLTRTNDDDKLHEDMVTFGVLKARYLAVDTPESTGSIERWGKAASRYTKTAIASAESVILESNDNIWNKDNNGRFLVWVWYKPEGETKYRNLNLELLQEGLAKANNATGSLYGELALKATMQAQEQKYYIYSNNADPEYYTGAAINTDLKTVRTHLEYFTGKRVALTATVTCAPKNGTIYIEDLDNVDENGMYYGMPVFYGMDKIGWASDLAVGNKVFLVGELSLSEAGFGYQLVDLKHTPMRPSNPENIKVIATNCLPGYKETTIAQFKSQVTVDIKTLDPTTNDFIYNEDKEAYETKPTLIGYAEATAATSLSMKNLQITDMYTTTKEGDNNGAMTITCKSGDQTIDIRTAVLFKRDENGEYLKDEAGNFIKVTEADFNIGDIIDVKGIVDYYEDSYSDFDYQVKVFDISHITIH